MPEEIPRKLLVWANWNLHRCVLRPQLPPGRSCIKIRDVGCYPCVDLSWNYPRGTCKVIECQNWPLRYNSGMDGPMVTKSGVPKRPSRDPYYTGHGWSTSARAHVRTCRCAPFPYIVNSLARSSPIKAFYWFIKPIMTIWWLNSYLTGVELKLCFNTWLNRKDSYLHGMTIGNNHQYSFSFGSSLLNNYSAYIFLKNETDLGDRGLFPDLSALSMTGVEAFPKKKTCVCWRASLTYGKMSVSDPGTLRIYKRRICRG